MKSKQQRDWETIRIFHSTLMMPPNWRPLPFYHYLVLQCCNLAVINYTKWGECARFCPQFHETIFQDWMISSQLYREFMRILNRRIQIRDIVFIESYTRNLYGLTKVWSRDLMIHWLISLYNRVYYI